MDTSADEQSSLQASSHIEAGISARDEALPKSLEGLSLVDEQTTRGEEFPDGQDDRDTPTNDNVSPTSNEPSVPSSTSYNIVCRAVLTYQEAQRVSVYLKSLENDIKDSQLSMQQCNLTQKDDRAEDDQGNAYNLVLSASDDPQDREILRKKHYVASVYISLHERWTHNEGRWFPDTGLEESLWAVISSNHGGLSDKGIDPGAATTLRNYFAHAFRDEQAPLGGGDDYKKFELLQKLYGRILPAIQAIKNKIIAALDDKGAWVSGQEKVSAHPTYAKDCAQAEERLQHITAMEAQKKAREAQKKAQEEEEKSQEEQIETQGSENIEPFEGPWGVMPDAPVTANPPGSGSAEEWPTEDWSDKGSERHGTPTTEWDRRSIGTQTKGLNVQNEEHDPSSEDVVGFYGS